MLDLTKIASIQEVTVPIISNSFQYNRKKYNTIVPYIDGWYRVKISGNTVQVVDSVFIEIDPIKAPTIKGYTYGAQIIFQNFDVAKRKLNKEIMAPLLLNSVESFAAVEAYIWEDGNLFYKSHNIADIQLIDIKMMFDENKSIKDTKGLTPELKTVYLFHEIQRQKYIKEMEALKKENDRLDYLRSFPGKLENLFKNVGATLVRFTKQAKDRIEVIWKIDSYPEEFNSIIDATSLRVLEAGYCMSGDDKRHSVSSMILTADDYAKRNKIHRIRGERW